MAIGNQSFSHVTTVEGNGVRIKTPPVIAVRAASTANIASLAACSTTFDGITLVAGDVILLKNQSTASQNGLYAVGDVASSAAALTRIWPLETGAELMNGTLFYASEGTAGGGEWWFTTNTGVATVGTTNLTFSRFAGLVDAAPAMQAADATLASGTVTINTGITVATNSEVVPVLIGAITGSTNFGSVGELKASRVAGAAGVGTVVIQAYGADGAIDSDAAGAIRVLIFTPVS